MKSFLTSFSPPVPASVTHLDAFPTGDQEVADLTLAGWAAFFHGDLIMKFILQAFPSADSRRSCQFLVKECAQYWLNA